MSRESWECERYPDDTIPGNRGWSRYMEALIAAEARNQTEDQRSPADCGAFHAHGPHLYRTLRGEVKACDGSVTKRDSGGAA